MPCSAPGINSYVPSTPAARARSKPRRESAGRHRGCPAASGRAIRGGRRAAGRGAAPRPSRSGIHGARPSTRSTDGSSGRRDRDGAAHREPEQERALGARLDDGGARVGDAELDAPPRLDPIAEPRRTRDAGTAARSCGRAIRATRSTFPRPRPPGRRSRRRPLRPPASPVTRISAPVEIRTGSRATRRRYPERRRANVASSPSSASSPSRLSAERRNGSATSAHTLQAQVRVVRHPRASAITGDGDHVVRLRLVPSMCTATRLPSSNPVTTYS